MASFASVSEIIGEVPGPLDNLSWLSKYIEEADKKKPSKIELVDFPNAGGLSNSMKIVRAEFDDNSAKTFVYKTMPTHLEGRSKQLGLYREPYFFHLLAPVLRSSGVSLPQVLYAYGSSTTGAKLMILEDLSEGCVQSGYFFGNGTPLNWGKDLPALLSKNNNTGVELSAKDVTKDAFVMAARMHATYWMDREILPLPWLRGVQWVSGNGKEQWETAQNTAVGYWKQTSEKIAAGNTTVKWNDLVVSCMNSSFAKISWDAYQEEMQSRPWTLVHGDFHPANAMWRWNNEKKADASGNVPVGETVLLDFEMIGIGSGPQDTAQYLISHCNPALRKELETEVVEEYYAALTGQGKFAGESRRFVNASEYPLEHCWRDYVAGGSARWVWLFALLSTMCPDPMVQYFHDQLYAFLADHNVTAENIGMPRV